MLVECYASAYQKMTFDELIGRHRLVPQLFPPGRFARRHRVAAPVTGAEQLDARGTTFFTHRGKCVMQARPPAERRPDFARCLPSLPRPRDAEVAAELSGLRGAWPSLVEHRSARAGYRSSMLSAIEVAGFDG